MSPLRDLTVGYILQDLIFYNLTSQSNPHLLTWFSHIKTKQFMAGLKYGTGSELNASASNVGDRGSIPGLGRSPGEGNGNPLPVFLPGEYHGRRRLVGYNPLGRKESDMIDRLHFTSPDAIMLTYCISCPSIKVSSKVE